MFEGKTIVTFIGARSGSKGLKDKNVISLAGKPLIEWTIQAALETPCLDRVVVSTDGEEIAQVARDSGAEVPFLRPEKLAGDDASLEDAVRHLVRELKDREGKKFDYVLILQPTSPLRTAKHIQESIEKYFQTKACENAQLVSVRPVPAKYGWLMKQDEKGRLDFCLQRGAGRQQRQELPEYFLPNGAIYFLPVSVLMAGGIYATDVVPYVMPAECSVDIDTVEDLKKAAAVLSQK